MLSFCRAGAITVRPCRQASVSMHSCCFVLPCRCCHAVWLPCNVFAMQKLYAAITGPCHAFHRCACSTFNSCHAHHNTAPRFALFMSHAQVRFCVIIDRYFNGLCHAYSKCACSAVNLSVPCTHKLAPRFALFSSPARFCLAETFAMQQVSFCFILFFSYR